MRIILMKVIYKYTLIHKTCLKRAKLKLAKHWSLFIFFFSPLRNQTGLNVLKAVRDTLQLMKHHNPLLRFYSNINKIFDEVISVLHRLSTSGPEDDAHSLTDYEARVVEDLPALSDPLRPASPSPLSEQPSISQVF